MIELGRPGLPDLDEVVGALADWQREDLALQLHPGDVGWAWRFGAEATAAALRTWRRGSGLAAVGFLDGPVVRLALAPDARQDEELARELVADLGDPARGVLGEGDAFVEAPHDALLHDRLAGAGWPVDAPWTPLRRDLAESVDVDVEVEVVGADDAESVAHVLRGAFERSTFSAERWLAMASGPAYADARTLLVRDGGDPAATVTVWSAGPGRPGLLEPMGVHSDHRGRGLGRAITLAGVAALRDLGASTADVCTMSSNVAGVAAYESAGFMRLTERLDRRRPDS